MPERVFRVCRSVYARLDGAGAKRAGGRWNSIGRSVVYTTESIALAVLENLVHMNRQDFPRDYVMIAASILWADSCASPILRVPSSIVSAERNYILNPKHPEFKRIVVEMPIAFKFDERLLLSHPKN